MSALVKSAIAFVAVFLLLGVVGLVLWIVGLKRAAVEIGKPTPEEARVKIDAAKKPVEAKAEKDVKEIRDASIEELDRLAHDLAKPPSVHGK